MTKESLDVDDVVLGEFYNVTVGGVEHKKVVCNRLHIGSGYIGRVVAFSTPNAESMTFHDEFTVMLFDDYEIEHISRDTTTSKE